MNFGESTSTLAGNVAYLTPLFLALGLLVSREAGFPAPVPNQAPLTDAERAPHPEPRVIVKVLSVRGPHDRSGVERSARQAWGRIIACYKASGERVTGTVTLRLTLAASGKVAGARRTKATLKNAELVRCLTGAMKGLAMPQARAGSTAITEIWVAPGDP